MRWSRVRVAKLRAFGWLVGREVEGVGENGGEALDPSCVVVGDAAVAEAGVGERLKALAFVGGGGSVVGVGVFGWKRGGSSDAWGWVGCCGEWVTEKHTMLGGWVGGTLPFLAIVRYCGQGSGLGGLVGVDSPAALGSAFACTAARVEECREVLGGEVGGLELVAMMGSGDCARDG